MIHNDEMISDDRRLEAINNLLPLIKEIVGDRSIRKASADMGMTSAYLSGILRGKHLPSVDMLRKMTSYSAKPQSDITLEQLMVAAGYQDELSSKDLAYIYDAKETPQTIAYRNFVVEKNHNERDLLERYYNIDYIKKGNSVKALIISELFQKGEYCIQNIDEDNRGLPIGWRSLTLDIADQRIQKWKLINCMSRTERVSSYHTIIHMMSTGLFRISVNPRLKISYVMDSQRAFEYLIERYEGKLPYRGELSIILINTDEMYIEKEVYLSNYYENDKNAEIYIVKR